MISEHPLRLRRLSALLRAGLSAFAATAAAVAFACAAVAATALAQVQPYGTNDAGGFRNILPPGTNGLDNALQLAQYEASSTKPPHSDDQLGMYSALTTAAPNITAAQIPLYFKDATFGVPAGQVGSQESPEPGVTIIRDSPFGVPHIYGDTRAALEFGMGYAAAEDRLFFIDVLRHYGRGDLASFAGGANVAMDEGVWASEPYTEQDLQSQIDYLRDHDPHGQQVYDDAVSYIDGLNAYVSQAENPLFTASKLPGEYAAIGQTPQPFKLTDLVAIATLVGGIFGKGGGAQLSHALLYENLLKRFGSEHRHIVGSPERASIGTPRATTETPVVPDRSGYATFLSFVDPADPEAPTTVRGRSFPYQSLPLPSRAEMRTVALPDAGSVRYPATVAAGSVPGSAADGGALGGLGRVAQDIHAVRQGLLSFPRSMSNALLVSARLSRDRRPLAVMGPQVSYYAPQVLMEEDVHGPGMDADGAAFPGVSLYVELGHGRDYAWSATSAGQNIIDTFAVPLCDPAGGNPSLDSTSYILHGRCVPMEVLTRQESWTPNAADQTPAGSVTFRTLRTAFGLVVARATVHGRPVVYTDLRSTYMHELDSAVGFYLYNDPAAMRNPQDFFRASYNISYTFNWFYVDDRHIAYFNSGLNPVRARHTDPLFPTWSSYPWRGFRGAPQSTPQSTVVAQTAPAAHPQALDQSYLTSWNNKQAPGYNDAATGQQFASVYRSELLDQRLRHLLRLRHGRLTLVDVINAMGDAGTQDLRGVTVLPYALRILGRPPRRLAGAVAELRRWVQGGAHRINRQHPGASGLYDQSAAVRIMDAWWPLLVRAEFGPILGSSLLGQVENEFPINDEPGHGASGPHLGSAWDVGFYGIVQKDLRSALGFTVAGALNRVYCGNGSLARCRRALLSSLSAAAGESLAQVYPADSLCAASDQMCSDSIEFKPIGAIKQPLIEWVNRPTFQQAVEVASHGPR